MTLETVKDANGAVSEVAINVDLTKVEEIKAAQGDGHYIAATRAPFDADAASSRTSAMRHTVPTKPLNLAEGAQLVIGFTKEKLGRAAQWPARIDGAFDEEAGLYRVVAKEFTPIE